MKGEYAMGNLDKALKSEIARISRREIRDATAKIGKSHTELKKVAADLKKRVASLEKENKRLVAEARKRQAEIPQKHHEDRGEARLTSREVRTLRKRLGVTQGDFAKLLGTSGHTVYLWEKKGGSLRLRAKTREALLSIKGLGATEARIKLEEIKRTPNKDKLPRSQKSRGS